MNSKQLKAQQKKIDSMRPDKKTVARLMSNQPTQRCYSCGQANASFYDVIEVQRAIGNQFDIVTYRYLGFCSFCDSFAQHTDIHEREEKHETYGNTSPSRFDT